MRVLLLILIFGLQACKEHQKHAAARQSTITPQVPKSSNEQTFQPLKENLYINSKGQLAFKMVDQTDPQKPHDDFVITIHADTLNYDNETNLNEIIDTATFSNIGDLYYRDKNHVYYHFPMMDGGMFYIVWEADPKSIKVLEDSYFAKDKKTVFCRGSVLEGADSKTFKVLPRTDKEVYQWSAKDKNQSYSGCDQGEGKQKK
jgi:hypothetical protein